VDVVGRVQRELVVARFIGKLAVDHGIAQVRRSLSDRREPPDATSPPFAPPTDPAGLALADYDQLRAEQIIGRLGGLTPDERAGIESYERAHRNRRTVLGRLEQLRHVDG
jgi:hypothetical protein